MSMESIALLVISAIMLAAHFLEIKRTHNPNE